MASKTLLAVSIPLAVILLISFLAIALLAIYLKLKKEDCSYFEKEVSNLELELIARPPKYALKGTEFFPGVSMYNLGPMFSAAQFKMGHYIEKWVHEEHLVDSEERIKNLLFPDAGDDNLPTSGVDNLPTSGGPRRPLFPNPHQYTALEICKIMSCKMRIDILHYILVSMVFPAVCLRMNGDPQNSLLPFGEADLTSLMQLLSMCQGRKFSTEVQLHLAQYQLYHARPSKTANGPWLHINREMYFDLFESLISPFLNIKADKATDVRSRREEFNKVLDVAVVFGMNALGVCGNHAALVWGPRADRHIVSTPALWCLAFEDDGSIIWPGKQRELLSGIASAIMVEEARSAYSCYPFEESG